MSKPPTLTADDAHGTKSWPLADIYTRAFDEFAGPKRFRHGSNDGAYHRAGLIAVWNAALAGIGVAAPSSEPWNDVRDEWRRDVHLTERFGQAVQRPAGGGPARTCLDKGCWLANQPPIDATPRSLRERIKKAEE